MSKTNNHIVCVRVCVCECVCEARGGGGSQIYKPFLTSHSVHIGRHPLATCIKINSRVFPAWVKNIDGFSFIPSFISDTPAAKQSRLRAQAELWRVKKLKVSLSKAPEIVPKKQKYPLFFGPSDDLLLFFTHSFTRS